MRKGCREGRVQAGTKCSAAVAAAAHSVLLEASSGLKLDLYSPGPV